MLFRSCLPSETLILAAQKMPPILMGQQERKSITDHNIAVGKRYFSFDVLRSHLSEAVRWASALVPRDGQPPFAKLPPRILTPLRVAAPRPNRPLQTYRHYDLLVSVPTCAAVSSR